MALQNIKDALWPSGKVVRPWTQRLWPLGLSPTLDMYMFPPLMPVLVDQGRQLQFRSQFKLVGQQLVLGPSQTAWTFPHPNFNIPNVMGYLYGPCLVLVKVCLLYSRIKWKFHICRVPDKNYLQLGEKASARWMALLKKKVVNRTSAPLFDSCPGLQNL